MTDLFNLNKSVQAFISDLRVFLLNVNSTLTICSCLPGLASIAVFSSSDVTHGPPQLLQFQGTFWHNLRLTAFCIFSLIQIADNSFCFLLQCFFVFKTFADFLIIFCTYLFFGFEKSHANSYTFGKKFPIM